MNETSDSSSTTVVRENVGEGRKVDIGRSMTVYILIVRKNMCFGKVTGPRKYTSGDDVV